MPPQITRTLLALAALLAIRFAVLHAAPASAQYSGWQHSGSLFILTTPDGANLPAGAVVEEFPVLVRLNRDWFDFSQAKPDGADVRFTTAEGKPLPHQIDEWDAKGGTAGIWVRVPRIEGNAKLPLHMHWGKADAVSASDGKAVFNESNGYLSVWHMGETVNDEAGTLESKESGTTVTAGVVGKARHFVEGAKISCGDKITGYPAENAPHTTELWFRAARSNVNLFGWGVQKQQGKVVMQFRGPPHVNLDCWFSDGNVASTGLLALNEWNHVVYAYESGNARIYLNGVLAGKAGRGTPLKIQSPASLSIGGWAGEFNFAGDLDEVRVSKVTRSADWAKLEYENQKPMQTLVGPLMRAPGKFALTPVTTSVPEGGRAKFTVQAGGAQKLYWYLVRDRGEEVVAVDRYAFDFAPGRVAQDTSMLLRLKAVYADRVETGHITVAVKKTIPDPEFTLTAPAKWDGRTPIELVPIVTNLDAMSKGDACLLQTQWSAGPAAVIKEVVPGERIGAGKSAGRGFFKILMVYPDKLRLLGAQNSGPLTVSATLSNGGASVSRSVTINVTEPTRDAWVQRKPERDEKPEEGQFYARDDRNEGTLFYNGTLTGRADEVFLKVFADDKPFANVKAKPAADLSYALTAKLKPGFVKYRVEIGTRSGGKETVLDKVGDLVCGDAFLIEGQSNAASYDVGSNPPCETNEWIRTFAHAPGGEAKNRPNLWRRAGWKESRPDNAAPVGWWGMELAKRLVASQKIPIFILNGSVGGTRIDQHQRNPENPADPATIYGRWLWRLQQARLTHGIRAILWHQGENDQPADTPDGDYGWKTYQRYFIDMAAGWRRDMPNARRYFMFQIWPNSCGMGKDGSGDLLREKQRTLPALFSNMSIMSTHGIRPPGGCHFPLEGYNEFARLMQPLIERDVYGKKPAAPITPPNLLGAEVAASDTLALHFDQPVKWNDALVSQFYLDGQKDKIAGGSVAGNVLTLKLKEPLKEKTITYLKEAAWSQDNLLWGENGIAALTFCEVPIGMAKKPN